MAPEAFDAAKSEAFAERMVKLLNEGALTLMLSIGHQVSLFDAMAELPASTPEQIAAKAGLNERYVREWLGAMVTGRVVDYDATERVYSLAPEHAAWLTRPAGTNNLAIQAQFIPLLAQVEEGIVASFRQGGGVPYSAYPRFQRLMAEDSATRFDSSLIDTTLPLVPSLVERLQAGIDVLDVGCGSGHAINLMARAFPHSRFTGYDLSEGGIASAQAEARQWGLSNASFAVRDLAAMNDERAFDFITAIDAIHDQAQPAAVLRAIARALKPDGTFLMVDIAASSNLEENMRNPLGPFMYTISCMHCMTVSLAAGGAGLGAMWGRQKAEAMLAEAGFTHIDTKRVEDDPLSNFYIARLSE